jgi:hypothetical protein
VKTGCNLAERSKGRLWIKKDCFANDADADAAADDVRNGVRIMECDYVGKQL